MNEDEDLPRYRLRLQEFARRQIEAESVRLAEIGGLDASLAWVDALQQALASLSTMPGRCPLAPEADRFGGVWRNARHILFRRTPGGVAWRVVFAVEESALDAPTVRILAVRHASARPMTRAEARQSLEDA